MSMQPLLQALAAATAAADMWEPEASSEQCLAVIDRSGSTDSTALSGPDPFEAEAMQLTAGLMALGF
jgi:hypothetical protein